MIDLSEYKKGMVWVNGHNLGRFWYIGPQQRLYCPAPWLKKGKNEIIVFDLLENQAKKIAGRESLEYKIIPYAEVLIIDQPFHQYSR
jgi:beta-galactosidase